MSNLLSSRDSPRRDSRRRLRSGRQQPLARSNSLFGALKNIVTAPLSWFSTHEDFEDTPGKRRRNPEAALHDERELEEGEGRAKRKRVHSPSPEPLPAGTIETLSSRAKSGYLDVPEQLLGQQAPRTRAPVAHNRATSLAVASRSEGRLSRTAQSPSPGVSYMQISGGIARTQSMDPPAMYTRRRDAAMVPLPISRDVSMESVMSTHSRDSATSPSHTHFQLRSRTSVTPQPVGQAFGPMPQRRDVSEPPPLDSLISNPVFVKPPTQLRRPQEQRQTETSVRAPSLTTLGSIAEARRQRGRSPSGHATLILGSQTTQTTASTSTVTPSAYSRPINAAEKALHDLDVYKTPLLPSRLRGSSVIPDMFRQKRIPAPMPMRSERDKEERPRLGTAERQKEKVMAAAKKPYAGQGGMRKLLTRRRMEEEEEREKERESAIEEDHEEEVEKAKEPTMSTEEQRSPERPSIRGPDFSTIALSGREQSSLRVGRTRASRNHIARPAVKSKNRFSAVYDEDEAEDMMNTAEEGAVEEPAKKSEEPLFKPPPGFSFAKEAPPIKQDDSAKEPPIAALPFSLSARTPSEARASASAEGAKPAFGNAPSVMAAPPVATAGFAPAAPVTAPPTAVPTISLVPPTPGPPTSGPTLAASISRTMSPPSVPAPMTAAASSGIPNFFANSPIFSKPGVSISPPSITPTPPAAPEDATATPPTPLFGATATAAVTTSEPKASLFGASGAAPTPLFGGQSSTAPVSAFGAKSATDAPTSAFGSLASKETTAMLGGLFSTEKTAAATTSLFGMQPQEAASSKEAAAPAPSVLAPAANIVPTSTFGSLFGKTASAKEDVVPNAPLFGPAPTPSTPAASAFSFGAPPKPAEPAAPSAAPFSFGAPAKPAESSAAAASSPFTFGAPKAEKEAETKAPSAEPPKPLFGAAPTPFSFGAPSATTSEAPKSAFLFGQPAAPAAAPTVEAPKPLFGSSTSGGFTFAQPASNAGADAAPPSKSPFSFGAPAIPQPAPATKSAFSFGAPSTTPSPAPTIFGAPSGSNAADVSKPFSFGAVPSTAQAITPPRDNDEVQMEESPARGSAMDTNGNGKPEEKPAGGFAFGTPSTPVSSSLFGQSNASPFSFGSTTPTSTPFGAKTDTKPEAKPALTFSGFGQTGSSAFSFGQKPAEGVQAPISPNPFGSTGGFGHTSTTPTPTATAPTFAFGAPPAVNTFGQAPPGAGSAPASPSTFGAPAAFSFGTPTSATAPSNPFSFGSQPASPATSNPGLPAAAGSSSGFAFGQPSSATAQPNPSPFGAAPPAPPAEGTLFTIGAASAPSNTVTGPGGRLVKKLPTRRGGKR